MGYEVKRVPVDFDWPINQTWIDYAVSVEFPSCPDCRSRGHSDGYSALARTVRDGLTRGTVPWPEGIGRSDIHRALRTIVPQDEVYCKRCAGMGELSTPELREWAESRPRVPIPEGEGWQLWETVGDSPISPVYSTASDLAEWMTTAPWRTDFDTGERCPMSSIEAALKFIHAGWAPTFGSIGGKAMDGIEFMEALREEG